MFTMMSHTSTAFTVTWALFWTSTLEIVCFTYCRWSMWAIHIYFDLLVVNSYLYHTVFLVFKDSVCFFYLAQWKTMGNERGCINLAFCNEFQHFLAVASIHTSCLESEVLAIHLWKRQHLSFIVEGNDRNDGIWTGTLPSELECVIGSSHFKNSVSSTMVAVDFSQTMIRFGFFNITQSRVQMPVGPAPIMRTVSSSLISEIRAAQNPVANTSPTNNACSSVTLSGIRFNP